MGREESPVLESDPGRSASEACCVWAIVDTCGQILSKPPKLELL
jgi:hypothetical protein